MNRLSIIFTISLISVLFAQASEPPQQKQTEPRRYYNDKVAEKYLKKYGQKVTEPFPSSLKASLEVSIISLLANPEKYHKKAVRVSGFLYVEHREDAAIYLSENDSDYLITKNGLAFPIDYDEWDTQKMNPRDFNKRYVVIEGVFNKNNLGHLGSCSGGFDVIWCVFALEKIK